MSVSNFTSATFSVVCLDDSCMYFCKQKSVTVKMHSNLRVKSLRVKARVKICMRVFCVDFSWKSAILHAIYARVSAAMPVA